MERLPRDLMIDITSRLPIKSVVRCKSVSKSLEAHLSDPLFAAAHFNRASTLTPFSNYIIRDTNEELHFIETEEEDSVVHTDVSRGVKGSNPHKCTFHLIWQKIKDSGTSTISKPKHLNLPFPFKLRTFLMGSCLGYVCLSATDEQLRVRYPTNPIYLFNPITGANILLPKFVEPTRRTTCLYGFGLDVSTQECKVLLVHVHDKTFEVQVHTVGRDYSWRTNTVPSLLTNVTDAELTGDELQTTLPLGFNGSIHWIVLSRLHNRFGPHRACILSFRLDTEVFGVIPMPEPLQVIQPYFNNSMFYALQVSGGCLSIIYSPKASFVDMWVMDDYNISESWVKKYSIQLNCMRKFQIRPIGFCKKGELMLELNYKGLVSYSTDSDGYKILSSCSIPFLFPFVGSLISLKSAHGDSKEPSSDSEGCVQLGSSSLELDEDLIIPS